MEQLRKGKLQQCLKLLDYAVQAIQENDVEEYEKMMSITYNNLGCYYRKINNNNKSL
jgi:hypothetical protein